MSEQKKYWHELPQEEVDKLIEEKRTLRHVLDNYLQPEWCHYPAALNGKMGCWSLNDNTPGGLRTKISNDFCKDCDCYKKNNTELLC